MKLSNLLQSELKIVEKKKIFFLVPVIILVIALIAGIIYGFVFGNPFNLGMDFTGGYTMQIKLASKLTTENYGDYKNQISEIFENLKDDNGEKYGVKVSSALLQGEGSSASINVRYQAIQGNNVEEIQNKMETEINVKLQRELQKLFKIMPSVVYENNAVKAVYPEIISDAIFNSIKAKVMKAYPVSENDIKLVNNNTVTVAAPVNSNLDSYRETMTVSDEFSGQVTLGDSISATISGELLTDAILAVVAAIVMMLIYIMFRFELSSAVAAIIGSFHDIIIMFAFMVIFHMEINATLIAALITILGYSINNTIIIFDRVRENQKSLKNKNMDPSWIANISVRDTLMRSINTTLTTVIMVAMIAIIGVPSIRIFTLPIILGLIAGIYSSLFISPAIWASWKTASAKKGKDTAKVDQISKPASN